MLISVGISLLRQALNKNCTCLNVHMYFFWSALFTFFEYSEVSYLLSAWELVHFLLWSWPCKSSFKIKISASVCNPLLSNRSSGMSFTEVFPGRMSLLCCTANRKALVCTWKHPQPRVRRGGNEFHRCPFLGWRPDCHRLMVKALPVVRCWTMSGWTQLQSLAACPLALVRLSCVRGEILKNWDKKQFHQQQGKSSHALACPGIFTSSRAATAPAPVCVGLTNLAHSAAHGLRVRALQGNLPCGYILNLLIETSHCLTRVR